MELLAVIEALRALKKDGLHVIITSDSKYVVDAVEKRWVFNWVKTGFKGKKNKDLWLKFLELYRRHRIQFRWIKGHNEHPENERCDVLATSAADSKNLAVDEGYEDSVKKGLTLED